MVSPEIARTSVRIASTGRSARPAMTHASTPTSTVRNAVSSQRPFPSSSADRCALSSGLATATVSGPFGLSTRWVNSTMSPTGDAICSPDRDAEVATSKPGGTNALLESTRPLGPMTQVNTGVRVATMTFERSAPAAYLRHRGLERELAVVRGAVLEAGLDRVHEHHRRDAERDAEHERGRDRDAEPDGSERATQRVTHPRDHWSLRASARHSRLVLPGSRRRAR